MTIDIFGNIPRVCTAIADWVACLIFLQHMKPRFSSRIHVLLSILFLPVMTAYMQLTDGFDGTTFNLFMLGSAIIMFLFMKLMSTSNLASIFFYCSRSFVLAGFVASFFWQMYSFGA